MNDKARLLIEKYLSGLCTSEEKQLVDEWLDEWGDGGISSTESDFSKISHFEKILLTRINETISLREKKTRKKKQYMYYISGIAASFIFCLIIATSVWLRDSNKEVEAEFDYSAVVPGSKSAVLLYGDGKELILENLEKSVDLANGIKVKQVEEGSTTLESLAAAGEGVEWNEVRVPKGGQYELKLMDGTKVIMNSASRIRFPNSFNSNERKIYLEGEAYFEVAHNQTPFIVSTSNTNIKVFGTEFNVRSYDGVSTIATLVSGSVQVSSDKGSVKMLKPNQQAISSEGILVKNVDVKGFTSWRRGYFSFDLMTIEEVMKELARWYDIDFEINIGVNKDEKIGGTYSRNKSLEDLLSYLSKVTGLKIWKKDGKVILTN